MSTPTPPRHYLTLQSKLCIANFVVAGEFVLFGAALAQTLSDTEDNQDTDSYAFYIGALFFALVGTVHALLYRGERVGAVVSNLVFLIFAVGMTVVAIQKAHQWGYGLGVVSPSAGCFLCMCCLSHLRLDKLARVKSDNDTVCSSADADSEGDISVAYTDGAVVLPSRQNKT